MARLIGVTLTLAWAGLLWPCGAQVTRPSVPDPTSGDGIRSQPDLGRAPEPQPMESATQSRLELDEADWIDPHDMGGKPLAPSDMLRRASSRGGGTPHGSGKSGDTIAHKLKQCSDCAAVQRSLGECKASLEAVEAGPRTAGSLRTRTTSVDQVFLQRYVKFLLHRFRGFEAGILQSDGLHWAAEIRFTQADLIFLQEFAKHPNPEDVGRLGELDRILSDMFVNIQAYEPAPAPLYGSYTAWARQYAPSSEDVLGLVVMSFVILVSYLLLCGMSVKQICLILLIVSTGFHWMYLYKAKVAEKHAAALTHDQSIPEECYPRQMSWSSYLGNFFHDRSSQKCLAYHHALHVDPFWEVTPTMALGGTITKLILDPVEHLGASLGKFFGRLGSELSWVSSPFVIVFTFVVIILVIIMGCGYQYRMPFFLGSFEPSAKPPANRIIEDLTQQIQLLKQLQANQELIHRTTLPHIPSDSGILEGTRPKVQELVKSHSVVGVLKVEVDEDDRPILSPPQAWKDSLKKSPKKKLVARGDINSPQEIEFEWVEEEEEAAEAQQANLKETIEPKKLQFDGIETELYTQDLEQRNEEYLKKLGELFEDPQT